jgi:hypothetical protein
MSLMRRLPGSPARRGRGQLHAYQGQSEHPDHEFISPTIIERLKTQSGLLTPQIKDWRCMVDSVMIDTAYDGKTFDITLADVPERKDDLVDGKYEVDSCSKLTATPGGLAFFYPPYLCPPLGYPPLSPAYHPVGDIIYFREVLS